MQPMQVDNLRAGPVRGPREAATAGSPTHRLDATPVRTQGVLRQTQPRAAVVDVRLFERTRLEHFARPTYDENPMEYEKAAPSIAETLTHYQFQRPGSVKIESIGSVLVAKKTVQARRTISEAVADSLSDILK